jgi:flagella basal body P-ring formation protein FlgA
MWPDRQIFFAAVLLAALSIPTVIAQPAISLREQAKTSGTAILLGDVADFHGLPDLQQQSLAAVALGSAPSGDAERILTRDQIKRQLERSGAKMEGIEFTGAESVRIQAALRLLDAESVARIIQDRLTADYPGGLLKLKTLKVILNGQVLVPDGEFTLVPVLRSSSGKPTNLVTVDLYSGQRRLRRFQVQTEWEWEATVATAARNLPFGHTLSEGDFSWVDRKSQDVPADLVLDAGALAGMRLRRPLQTGDLITREVLTAPLMVEKGDVVQLALRSSGFSIVTTGTAQQAGGSGDKIRVIQPESKRVYIGKIVGKNKVEITL